MTILIRRLWPRISFNQNHHWNYQRGQFLSWRGRRNLKRLFRFGSLALIGTFTGYYWSDITFLGRTLQRAMRTAWHVGLISWDYKQNFPSSVVETRERDLVHERAAKRLLHLFRLNGGVYIKVGQHLAALEYILPAIYCQTLAVLHKDAPASTFAEVKRVIEDELGCSLSQIFLEFDETPIGAASLAQVHRAILCPSEETGGVAREVAVKVQHYRIRSAVETDMFVIGTIVRLVKRLFPEFDFDWIADEMRTNLPRELDFISEAHNAERVAKNFHLHHGNDGFIAANNSNSSSGSTTDNNNNNRHYGRRTSVLRIPKIYWKYTTKQVLIMDYLPGAKATDREFLKLHGINPIEVSTLITRIFSEMIFIHGFVHCDPHPGNLLIRPIVKEETTAMGAALLRRLLGRGENGTPFELALLDHGLYRELRESFRRNYAALWGAVIASDELSMAKYAQLLLGGGESYYRLLSCILTQRPWRTIAGGNSVLLRERIKLDEIAEIRAKAPQYLAQVADLLSQLPRPLLLLLKTNDLLRHLERALLSDPHQPPHTFTIMAHYCIDAVYDNNDDANGKAEMNGQRNYLLVPKSWQRFLTRWYYHLKIYLLEAFLQWQYHWNHHCLMMKN